jgi:adenylate cyclase
VSQPDTPPPPAAPPESLQRTTEAQSTVDKVSKAFWERIKRHKIVQWTLAYLALAYTLLHGAEMLSGALGWSHGLVRIFTLVLIIGVPIVVILAWYHGARGQQRVSATEVMIIALLLGIGGALLWRDTKTEHAAQGATKSAAQDQVGGDNATEPPAPYASIAVLAFSDMSAEGNQGYFSDGIAEEVLNALAHVGGLKVASRTSSFQFRKSDLGAPAIAQKLGVRHILEGSVRKAGSMVRITAQLIDGPSDQHLWSQTFDRPLTTANLFAIQDEIAKAIVDQLTTKIGRAPGTVMPGAATTVTADTANVKAYDLYLQGRSLFIARNRQNLSRAASVLKQALAIDPKFARAWETLAAVYTVSEAHGVRELADYQHAALEAAATATRLDPKLSLPFAVRGMVQSNLLVRDQSTSWEESIANLTQAIENDPQDATAYFWRSNAFQSLGYFERGRADLQRCLEIDPAYDICRRFLGESELFQGHVDSALSLYEAGLQNGYLNGDAFFLPALTARGDRIGALGILVLNYQDKPELIRLLFRAMTDPSFSDRDRNEGIAFVDAGLPNKDLAFEAFWILKAYDRIAALPLAEAPLIWWAPGDDGWLRSAARKTMMKQWRLPDYWRKHGYPPQCKAIGASDFDCH